MFIVFSLFDYTSQFKHFWTFKKMKRTFLAIEISPDNELLNVYNHLKEAFLNEKMRWVDPIHFHITLFFLGDTGEAQIPSIISKIEQSVTGISSFDLVLNGFEVFPAVLNPNVLWIGIEKNEDILKLKKSIDKVLESFGFKAEKRKFTPHLTIARVKEVQNKSLVNDLLNKFKNVSIGLVKINKLVFFESRLTPNGPAYNKLSEFHFL
jgi:RNA 2',3'-cyclic 3'-phosphodiesterase